MFLLDCMGCGGSKYVRQQDEPVGLGPVRPGHPGHELPPPCGRPLFVEAADAAAVAGASPAPRRRRQGRGRGASDQELLQSPAHGEHAAAAAQDPWLGGLAPPPQGASRRAQVAAQGAQGLTRRRWPAGADGSACVVCQQPLAAGDTIWQLPCGHCEFHEACAHGWLQRRGACPVCRAPVEGIPQAAWAAAEAEAQKDQGKKPKGCADLALS